MSKDKPFKGSPLEAFLYLIEIGLRSSLRPYFDNTEERKADFEKAIGMLMEKIMNGFAEQGSEVWVLGIPMDPKDGRDPACILVTLTGHVSPLLPRDEGDKYFEHLKMLHENPGWTIEKKPNLKVI